MHVTDPVLGAKKRWGSIAGPLPGQARHGRQLEVVMRNQDIQNPGVRNINLYYDR